MPLLPSTRILNRRTDLERPHVRRPAATPSRSRRSFTPAGSAPRRGRRAGAALRRLAPRRSGGFTASGSHGVTAEEPILIPDGERFKHLATVGRIYDALIRAGADRASAIVAVGGGVIGDVAGFAAATYLRGIPVVQVPTTLLAQVDSAVGGKVGVNHAAGKNLIGAFHPPATVVVDPELLATLPRREFRAGLYEVVKYGVIASRPLFDRTSRDLAALFARDAAALLPGRRRVLPHQGEDRRSRTSANQGCAARSTSGTPLGHALEAVTKYRRFRHGEAVGYGMLAASALAVARGVLPDADRAELASLITQMGPLPAVSDLSATEVVDAIKRDKKVIAGRLHFVLPDRHRRDDDVNDVTLEELMALWGRRRDVLGV